MCLCNTFLSQPAYMCVYGTLGHPVCVCATLFSASLFTCVCTALSVILCVFVQHSVSQPSSVCVCVQLYMHIRHSVCACATHLFHLTSVCNSPCTQSSHQSGDHHSVLHCHHRPLGGATGAQRADHSLQPHLLRSGLHRREGGQGV